MLSRMWHDSKWMVAVPLGVAGLLACGGDQRPPPAAGAASPGASPSAPATPGAAPGAGAPGSTGSAPAVAATLEATPAVAPSDGSPVVVAMTLRDALGNPVPGAGVQFSGAGVNILTESASTGAAGVASTVVSSLKPGTRTITAVAAGVPAATTVVTFTSGGCADGSSFPSGGYVIGSPAVPVAANWSPNVFTGTAGSIFVPDTSVYENNDPSQPLTGGGHNWVFDQGSTLCKETDVGPAGGAPTGWSIPPNSPTNCIVLPIIKGGRVVNIGDIPYQGDVVTPTCDPTLLSQPGSPNLLNTYFNQLGCSISHGAPTTPRTATSFLFVAGIKGGLFSIPLDNVTSAVVGGNAGKVPGAQNYYSAIPEGQKLTNATVSRDGQFAIATSIRRAQPVWACLNPLGDPGDPSLPIDPGFTVPPAASVKCMSVGNNALAVDLTTEFGPDGQPYFGGQRVVNAFNSTPGGSSNLAWPSCIWRNNGSTSLADAFLHNRSNGCGNALPDFGFSSANIIQPQALVTHGDYMYTGPVGGTLVQFKVTKDPISGLSQYRFRTYATGFSITTGIGVAEDLGSLMVYSDPTAIGAAGQEIVTRLPLCEDM